MKFPYLLHFSFLDTDLCLTVCHFVLQVIRTFKDTLNFGQPGIQVLHSVLMQHAVNTLTVNGDIDCYRMYSLNTIRIKHLDKLMIILFNLLKWIFLQCKIAEK